MTNKIENASDLFLLFLPNLSMRTPFHILLSENKYTIFNDLVERIELEVFNQFISDKNYINKIMDLFIYILEEHVTYPLDAIKNNYCSLPVDMDFLDFNDPVEFYEYDYESDEDKLSKKVRDNRTKLNAFLNEIINEVLKNDSFVKRNDFNFSFKIK